MGTTTIRERFAHPPAEFGPTPFWFINDDLDEGRLCSALEEMKAKGIAGVIIHPRTGMEVEYLSETFWDRLKFICETLKRLGMQGWIYDEYNWPSGPVGGKLLREHPEFKQVGIMPRLCPASKLQDVLEETEGDLGAAFSVTASGVTDRTEELKNGDLAAFRGGEALLFFLKDASAPLYATHCAPWTKGEKGYLDLLNPDAVDEFMRLTHFEYDNRLKEYYGSPLIGIFTDEPANYSHLPYTPAMPAEFERRNGESFWSAMPSLTGHITSIPAERRIRDRTRYFELARDLYVESFFEKISAWAKERGLIFTGHLFEEDKLSRLPAMNVSFFAPLSRMDMPGTDILSDRHGYEKTHGMMEQANFNPKALGSVAHHSGAERTLCEIWGGNGWATPPERLKAVLNWAQACGVNFVNPHAAFMSLKGLRKRDFPSSHFPPQPWWRFYDKFSEYIARLSYINTRGRHAAEILFAYPVKSLWANFDLRQENSPFADLIENASETLLRHQLDFDYLFDEVLDSGSVSIEGSKLRVAEELYSALLLPLADVMPGALLDLAERFAEADGRIIAFGPELPRRDEYGTDISARVQALLGKRDSGEAVYCKLGHEIGPGGMEWLAEAARDRVSADLVIEGAIARDMIYLHRKAEGADYYFVANLSEKEGRVELTFCDGGRSGGRPQVWDPEDGSTLDVLAYEQDSNGIRLNFWFHPNQAQFFVFTDEPPVEHVDTTNLTLTSVTDKHASGYTSALEVRLSHGGERYTRSVDRALPPISLPDRWELDYPVRNILLLDEWEIELLSPVEPSGWSPSNEPRFGARARILIEATRGGLYLRRMLKKLLGGVKHGSTKYERIDDLTGEEAKWSRILGLDVSRFEEYELAEVLLNVAEYAGMSIGKDFPPPGCEFAMSAVFHLDHIPDDLALVYEDLGKNPGDGPRSIKINGVEITQRGEPTYVWDSSNLALPITQFVRPGENRLRLEWEQPSFSSLFPSVHGIEPVCLTGCFWVKKGRVVKQKYGASALPWAKIGLPNYIGTLTYKSSFELPQGYTAQQLFLKFENIGTAAEVKINGKRAGVMLWRPYSLDISGLAVEGENSIEVTVANTAANLLGKPVDSGIIGRTYIAPYWRHKIRLRK
jgi:hypothetical protein